MFTGLAENSEGCGITHARKKWGDSRMANSRTPRGTLLRCRPIDGTVFYLGP